jgi:7-keto-8-aminopelargonate synthetase-like enzyme
MDAKDDSASWADQLAELSAAGLRRSLRVIESAQGPRVRVGGRELINFSSNDYLGLASHPYIRQRVKEAVDQWGWGAPPSSSQVMGPHAELASRPPFKQTEAVWSSRPLPGSLAAIRGLAGRRG